LAVHPTAGVNGVCKGDKMSKSEKALSGNDRTEGIVAEGPALILEKYLLATVQLYWRVQQGRNRSNNATPTKTPRLCDAMAGELEFFIASIRKRLESWKREEPDVMEMNQVSYQRLFPVDTHDLHDQLEVLLCGYAHYARQTSEACTKLRDTRDAES